VTGLLGRCVRVGNNDNNNLNANNDLNNNSRARGMIASGRDDMLSR